MKQPALDSTYKDDVYQTLAGRTTFISTAQQWVELLLMSLLYALCPFFLSTLRFSHFVVESGQFSLYDNRIIWVCSHYINAKHVLIKEKHLTWSPLSLSLSLSLPRSLPLSGRSLSKQNKSSQGLVGLRNLGNTVSVPFTSRHTWRHCTS